MNAIEKVVNDMMFAIEMYSRFGVEITPDDIAVIEAHDCDNCKLNLVCQMSPYHLNGN